MSRKRIYLDFKTRDDLYSIAKIQNACLEKCLADGLLKLIHLSWFRKCIRTTGIFDTKEQIKSFFCASEVS